MAGMLKVTRVRQELSPRAGRCLTFTLLHLIFTLLRLTFTRGRLTFAPGGLKFTQGRPTFSPSLAAEAGG